MNKITAAYIAGLLDGEGCFRIDRFASERSPIGYQYRTTVELTMCEKDTVSFVAAATGKNVYQRKKPLPSGRIVYAVIWRNSIAADLIRTILPYLRGKKEQAEHCLYFEDHITPGRGRTYTQEDAIICESACQVVKALKRPDSIRC